MAAPRSTGDIVVVSVIAVVDAVLLAVASMLTLMVAFITGQPCPAALQPCESGAPTIVLVLLLAVLPLAVVVTSLVIAFKRITRRAPGIGWAVTGLGAAVVLVTVGLALFVFTWG